VDSGWPQVSLVSFKGCGQVQRSAVEILEGHLHERSGARLPEVWMEQPRLSELPRDGKLGAVLLATLARARKLRTFQRLAKELQFGLWILPNDIPVDEARPQTQGGRCGNVCPPQPDMRALILKHREAVFKALDPVDMVIMPRLLAPGQDLYLSGGGDFRNAPSPSSPRLDGHRQPESLRRGD